MSFFILDILLQVCSEKILKYNYYVGIIFNFWQQFPYYLNGDYIDWYLKLMLNSMFKIDFQYWFYWKSNSLQSMLNLVLSNFRVPINYDVERKFSMFLFCSKKVIFTTCICKVPVLIMLTHAWNNTFLHAVQKYSILFTIFPWLKLNSFILGVKKKLFMRYR